MQSDKEKKDGLPIAPFMDRDRVTKPSAQIGFIRFVLLPLFESLNKVKLEIAYYFINPHKIFVNLILYFIMCTNETKSIFVAFPRVRRHIITQSSQCPGILRESQRKGGNENCCSHL